MTFGNDKLTNFFPPLITLQRKIPKKNFQKKILKISCAEISAGDFTTKNFMFSAIWMKRVGLTALNRNDRGKSTAVNRVLAR